MVRHPNMLFHVKLIFQSGFTQTIKVYAASREIAERMACKRYPNAKGVKR